MREKVQELQRDNSAQQAQMLMSALGGSGGLSSSSGLGGLMSGATAGGDEDEDGQSEQEKRLTQLEREISNLTNENLKLKE